MRGRSAQDAIGEAKPRILHVEDDADIARIVSDVVGSFAQITRASGVGDAGRHLEQGAFDLVILDLLLPDGTGEELLPLLRRGEGGSIPIIVFSSKEVAREQLENFEHMLIKSRTSNDVLLNTIRSAIAQPRPAEQLGGASAATAAG